MFLFTFTCLIQSNVEVTVQKLYNYSTVLGAAIKCRLYSEIKYSGNWDTFKNCKNYIECRISEKNKNHIIFSVTSIT